MPWAKRLCSLYSPRLWMAAGIGGAALAHAPVLAQGAPSVARPVVQQLPRQDGRTLDAALGRLARDPRDVGALIDAGNAALAIGDSDAAAGFFRRADQVAPGDPRARAGLAGAMVRSGDPFAALPLFAEAEKTGALDAALVADHGLAYDLVGDNAAAQVFYRQSLAGAPSDEVIRRLALSQAISGDKAGAEQTLSPLLAQHDRSAWRTRAFVLAIGGQAEEAVSIANSVLPADLAAAVAPYLRYMPRLTKAQQAAAANFGNFPRAADIGRDDPRVALYAPAGRRSGTVASADAALVPRGAPLGAEVRSRNSRQTRQESREAQTAGTRNSRSASLARVAPPEPQPARGADAVRPSSPSSLPPVSPPSSPPARIAAASTTAPPVFGPPAFEPQVSPPSTPPAPTPPTPPTMAPAFNLPRPIEALRPATPLPTPATVPAVAPPPPSPPPPSSARRRSLAEAFSEFGAPSLDGNPAPGAVDLRRLAPAKPGAAKPVAPPKPPPPSHPSRIWVQVATGGRDLGALATDWRRITREAAEALRGKQGFTSTWGQRTRLLAGPFPSEAAASAFVAQLRRADVEGTFIWTSPAGQVVDALPKR